MKLTWSGVDALRQAIAAQAVEDYKQALRGKGFDGLSAADSRWVLREFFKGEGMEGLCLNLDGEAIVKKCDDLYRQEMMEICKWILECPGVKLLARQIQGTPASRLTPERTAVKAEIDRLIEEGWTMRDACAQAHIAPSTYSAWVKGGRKVKEEQLPPRIAKAVRAAIEAELKKMEKERHEK